MVDISQLWLNGKQPCRPAQDFCARFATLNQAWQECERSDWLIWYGVAIGADFADLATKCAKKAWGEKATWEIRRHEEEAVQETDEAICAAAHELKAPTCNLIREFWPTPPRMA
jgi:hypothetical protein